MRPVLVQRFFAAVSTADPLLFAAAVLLAVHALPELGAQDDASELGEPLREHRYQGEHWIGKKPNTVVFDPNPGWPDPSKFVITF